MRMSPSLPSPADRDVVLADLVGLRAVGIEVVLAVEDRARRDLALERRGDLQRVEDRLLVGHRQDAGVGEADRAGVDVRLVAEGELAAAEHLRPGRQLDVDLEPDHRLQLSHRLRPPRRLRPGVEADRLLQRVGGLEQLLLGEGRARRSGSRPAARGPPPVGLGEPGRDRDRRDPGEAHRHGEEVVEVHRERVVGLLAEPEGDRGRGRGDDEVDRREGRGEVLGDLRPHLLRLAVVGVVVAGGERVGAEHDPPLHLGAEALARGSSRTSRAGRRRRSARIP